MTIFRSIWTWTVLMLLVVVGWTAVPAMMYDGPDLVNYTRHFEARCQQEFYGNNVWVEKCYEETWVLAVGNPHLPREISVSKEVYDAAVVGSESPRSQFTGIEALMTFLEGRKDG